MAILVILLSLGLIGCLIWVSAGGWRLIFPDTDKAAVARVDAADAFDDLDELEMLEMLEQGAITITLDITISVNERPKVD